MPEEFNYKGEKDIEDKNKNENYQDDISIKETRNKNNRGILNQEKNKIKNKKKERKKLQVTKMERNLKMKTKLIDVILLSKKY